MSDHNKIVVKQILSKPDIDAYLKKYGLQKSQPFVPKLYLDSCEEIALGAFINGFLVGILLGCRIQIEFKVYLIHAAGKSHEAVEEFLRKAFWNRAAQFNPKYI